MKLQLDNTDMGDLFVTVLDLNLAPGAKPVLDNQRVNERDSVFVDVQLDGRSKFDIRWTAVRADDPGKTATREISGDDNPAPIGVTTFFG